MNIRRITQAFWIFFGMISLFFLLYTPVSFYVHGTNIIQLNSRITIFVFFIVPFTATAYSWWDTKQATRLWEKTLLDSTNLILNVNRDEVQNELVKIKKGLEGTFLNSNWLNYEKSLRRIKNGITPEGEVRENYYATVEAAGFFSDDLITSNGYKLPFSVHKFIPQMLIAIGLFGTFLGLVIGLMGLDFQDTSNTKSSIELLLSGVQVSFRSSLYGVAFSLLLTTFQNLSIGHLESKLHQFNSALDGLFPMNTQEDGINEIYQELEKQTGSIQKMATEIAEGVGNRFDSAMQSSLLPALVNLEKVSKQLIETSEKNNQHALSSIVDNIGNIITSSTQTELSNLRQSLATITDKNMEMFESFNQSMSKMQDINDNQLSIMAESSTSMINMEKLNVTISSLQEKLSSTVESLDQSVKNQNQSTQDYFSLMEQIKENITIQNRSNQVFENVVTQNAELSSIQQAVIADLASTCDSLNRLNQEIPQTLEAITRNTLEFEQAGSRVNNQLIAVVDKMAVSYENINESIAEVSVSFDESIGVLKDQVLDELSQISKSYVAIAENLQDFSQTANHLTDEMKGFINEQRNLHSFWDSYKHSFDALNSEINEGLGTYSSTIKQSLRDTFEQYDSSLTKVLSMFKSTLEDLHESIEELQEVFHQQSEIA